MAHSLNKAIYTLTVITACMCVGGCTQPVKSALQPSPPRSSPSAVPSPTPLIERLNSTALKNSILQRIEQEKIAQPNLIVGIVIEDYLTGDLIEINADEVFDAASIGKLPILMLVYEQIKEGKITESETITITEDNVERYGTGSIQYQKLPKQYTIIELARLMINVSDNTASSVLATKIGRNNLAAYVQKQEMSGTNTKENDTIPYDTMILLRELFVRQQSDDPYAKKMIEFMTNTAFEDRLAAGVPKEVQIAHKIGTQTGQFHDAGIVFHPDRPYGIAVYTKNAINEASTKSMMAGISQQVYTSIADISTK